MGKLDMASVRFWNDEIASCIKRQEEELIKRNVYPDIIKYYEGDVFIDTSKGQFQYNSQRLIFINEYFPNTNALISELVYQNPEPIVTARKPESVENEKIMKSALDYGIKKLDADTENRLALFDMIYAGYCGVEINHINIQNEKDNISMSMSDKYSNLRTENPLQKIISSVKKTFQSQKEVEENLEKESEVSESSYSTEDETFLKRWNPLDILLDWRADRVKDMRYVIKRIRYSQAEFYARYPEFKDKVKPSDVIQYGTHVDESQKKSIILYEIQVKKKNNKYVSIVISPTWYESEIDYFVRPYTTNGFNIKISTLHNYGKLYPISFAKVNKALQDDINNYATFMSEVAERNIPKIGYNKLAVEKDGVSALRSNKINDLVPTQGPPANHIQTLAHTNVSVENKELLQIFQQQKEKLWNVSESKLMGRSTSKFATEISIQEAGFETRQIDLQQGLRNLWKQELETLKDIIVQFWDGEYFFKITGSEKPEWYSPQLSIDPMTGKNIVMNPLTEILSMDYEIDVDIISGMRPNKERKKKELIDFATWLTSPNVQGFLQAQGYMVNIETIKKVAVEWGWNADNLIVQAPPPPLTSSNNMQEEQIPEQVPQQGVM